MALKLGKGSAFVKSRLRRLPQNREVWEADFVPERDYWMGIAVEREEGAVCALKFLEAAPTVNDLARLMAHAMERPLLETHSRRPRCIRLRDNPAWQELVPHLEELDIEIVFTEGLRTWDAAVADCRFPVADFKNLWLAART